MLKQAAIFLFLSITPLSGYCEKIVIPGSNLSFTLSDKWVEINEERFSNILKIAQQYDELENIDEVLSISQTYGFIKTRNASNEVVNSNIIILSIYAGDEKLDLETVLESQIPSKSRVIGVKRIVKGGCPSIPSMKYVCLTQYSERGSRATTQYHYLIMANDHFVQVSMNAATSEEIAMLADISSTLKSNSL